MDNFRTLTETRQVAADLTRYSPFARGLLYAGGVAAVFWLVITMIIITIG